MGNVVSYFMQKPEGVPVAKKDGCCSENKLERIEDPPVANVAHEEIIEAPATNNVGDPNIHETQKLQETDVGDDFEMISEEKQQKPADILEAAAEKDDDRIEIEEKLVSSENKELVESLISDNKQISELDEKSLAEYTETLLPDQQEGQQQTEISASTDTCEIVVQKTELIQEKRDVENHDQIEALQMKDEDTEEVAVEDIKQEQNLEDINGNEQFDRNISETQEKDDSTENTIALSEEQTKSDSENVPETLSQKEEGSSCSQEPMELDTIKFDPELADTEKVAYDEKLNINPGQEESLLDNQKDVYVESHATAITAKDIEMAECNENESKTENQGYENQDTIQTIELCDETPDIKSHNESVERIEYDIEAENADTIKSTIELDCTAKESPDQVSNIETVGSIQDTTEDDHCMDDSLSNNDETQDKNPKADCEKLEDVDALESTAKDNSDTNEENKSAEMIQSDEESKPEDCNTLEGILDQESDIGAEDDLHIDESVSKPDKIEGKENVDDKETQLIGSFEDDERHSEPQEQTDILNSLEEPIEDENKELNTEKVTEKKLEEEEDAFSKVIDHCKMEIENIQNSIVGSVETEEIGEKKNLNEVDCSSQELDQVILSANINDTVSSEDKIVTETKSTFLENESVTNGNKDECETMEETTAIQEEVNVCFIPGSENVESLSNNPSKESSVEVEDQSEYPEQATEVDKTKSDEDICKGSIPDELVVNSSNEEQIEETKSVRESTEDKIKDTVIASSNGLFNEIESLEDITTTKETDAECCDESDLK